MTHSVGLYLIIFVAQAQNLKIKLQKNDQRYLNVGCTDWCIRHGLDTHLGRGGQTTTLSDPLSGPHCNFLAIHLYLNKHFNTLCV